MSNNVDEDGYEELPEFDPEEAKKRSEQEDREIEAEIKLRENA